MDLTIYDGLAKTPALHAAKATEALGFRCAGEGGESDPSGNNATACFEQIRDMIIHGHLAPGSRIVEIELAERLGVSRTPVRGALQILQREGYIISETIGSRKTRLTVVPVTKEDGIELFWIISRLEGLAARAAAGLKENARMELVASLEEYNSAIQSLAEDAENDPNRIFDLDMGFHQELVFAGAGDRLKSLHRSVQPQVQRYLRFYANSIVNQLRLSAQEHHAIIRAIDEGDADASERAMQVNWESGSKRLSEVIDTLGERGAWRKKV